MKQVGLKEGEGRIQKLHAALVRVRDSRSPREPVLDFTEPEWSAAAWSVLGSRIPAVSRRETELVDLRTSSFAERFRMEANIRAIRPRSSLLLKLSSALLFKS